MRNPENNNNEGRIKVTIGKFGSSPQVIEVAENTTVEEALEEAGLTYTEGNIFVAGVPAQKDSELDDGDIINVVTSKQGGVK